MRHLVCVEYMLCRCIDVWVLDDCKWHACRVLCFIVLYCYVAKIQNPNTSEFFWEQHRGSKMHFRRRVAICLNFKETDLCALNDLCCELALCVMFVFVCALYRYQRAVKVSINSRVQYSCEWMWAVHTLHGLLLYRYNRWASSKDVVS